MKRLILFIISISTTLLAAHAQLGQCNSPYSRFGLGLLTEQSQGFNRSMSGVGIGIRQGNVVNYTNPASYSAIDSLALIIDAGMSLSAGTISQNGSRQVARSAQLDYVSVGLRLHRGLGMSLGFMPFSRIGYQFEKTKIIANDPSQMLSIKSTSSYAGDGGLHQAYLGLGWNPFAKLSVGANVGLLWGTCNHQATQTFEENGTSSSTFNKLTSLHQADLTTYNLDFGVQYPFRLTNMDWLTAGATATIGHSIKSNAVLERNAGSTTAPADTISAPFDIPFTYGVGLSWKHGFNWLVAADVKYEQWSKCHTPAWDNSNNAYVAETGEYKDRVSMRAGVQYIPAPLSRNYFSRIQYRFGVRYASPYLVINGQDGPHEYGLSLGVALPITNHYSNRSTVNVGFEWMQRNATASSLIKENYFMMTLGLTFNEMWFYKFKIK